MFGVRTDIRFLTSVPIKWEILLLNMFIIVFHHRNVYSFGLVVLEVATGKRPVDDAGTVLVDWYGATGRKGNLLRQLIQS